MPLPDWTDETWEDTALDEISAKEWERTTDALAQMSDEDHAKMIENLKRITAANNRRTQTRKTALFVLSIIKAAAL